MRCSSRLITACIRQSSHRLDSHGGLTSCGLASALIIQARRFRPITAHHIRQRSVLPLAPAAPKPFLVSGAPLQRKFGLSARPVHDHLPQCKQSNDDQQLKKRGPYKGAGENAIWSSDIVLSGGLLRLVARGCQQIAKRHPKIAFCLTREDESERDSSVLQILLSAFHGVLFPTGTNPARPIR